MPQSLSFEADIKGFALDSRFCTTAFNSADKVWMSNHFNLDTFESLLRQQQL